MNEQNSYQLELEQRWSYDQLNFEVIKWSESNMTLVIKTILQQADDQVISNLSDRFPAQQDTFCFIIDFQSSYCY